MKKGRHWIFTSLMKSPSSNFYFFPDFQGLKCRLLITEKSHPTLIDCIPVGRFHSDSQRREECYC